MFQSLSEEKRTRCVCGRVNNNMESKIYPFFFYPLRSLLKKKKGRRRKMDENSNLLSFFLLSFLGRWLFTRPSASSDRLLKGYAYWMDFIWTFMICSMYRVSASLMCRLCNISLPNFCVFDASRGALCVSLVETLIDPATNPPPKFFGVFVDVFLGKTFARCTEEREKKCLFKKSSRKESFTIYL